MIPPARWDDENARTAAHGARGSPHRIRLDEWQVERALPLPPLLKEDLRDVAIAPAEAFPRGNTRIASEETAALVAASGVDAVIVGGAA